MFKTTTTENVKSFPKTINEIIKEVTELTQVGKDGKFIKEKDLINKFKDIAKSNIFNSTTTIPNDWKTSHDAYEHFSKNSKQHIHFGKHNHEYEKPEPGNEKYSNKTAFIINKNVVAVGDTHGEFKTTQDIVLGYCDKNNMPKNDKVYLFLGDYIDYGYKSMANLLFVLELTVNYPQLFVLLRGNHELRYTYECNIETQKQPLLDNPWYYNENSKKQLLENCKKQDWLNRFTDETKIKDTVDKIFDKFPITCMIGQENTEKKVICGYAAHGNLLWFSKETLPKNFSEAFGGLCNISKNLYNNPLWNDPTKSDDSDSEITKRNAGVYVGKGAQTVYRKNLKIDFTVSGHVHKNDIEQENENNAFPNVKVTSCSRRLGINKKSVCEITNGEQLSIYPIKNLKSPEKKKNDTCRCKKLGLIYYIEHADYDEIKNIFEKNKTNKIIELLGQPAFVKKIRDIQQKDAHTYISLPFTLIYHHTKQQEETKSKGALMIYKTMLEHGVLHSPGDNSKCINPVNKYIPINPKKGLALNPKKLNTKIKPVDILFEGIKNMGNYETLTSEIEKTCTIFVSVVKKALENQEESQKNKTPKPSEKKVGFRLSFLTDSLSSLFNFSKSNESIENVLNYSKGPSFEYSKAGYKNEKNRINLLIDYAVKHIKNSELSKTEKEKFISRLKSCENLLQYGKKFTSESQKNMNKLSLNN